jgi:enoyl-CoA hydratase/carnithine racemase
MSADVPFRTLTRGGRGDEAWLSGDVPLAHPSEEASMSFQAIRVTHEDRVATVTMLPIGAGAEGARDLHADLATAFAELRVDDSVRVIVLTGAGTTFLVPGPRDAYESGGLIQSVTEPASAWAIFSGIVRCHHAMVEIEKPIIARVNGDAIGFGQSMMFACDLIVANADAQVMDHHMGGTFVSNYDGQMRPGGHAHFSTVPGDGGVALVPLFMSPCRAKEYLMLARSYSASELEDLGAINYAVALDELDAKVNELVEGLLGRNPYALAWTKRVANRRVAEHLNLTLDAGVAYEMVSFYQLEKLGTQEPKGD